jgi:hypothetical protein
MQECVGVSVWIPVFLTSTQDGVEYLDSRPDSFTPEERTPGTVRIGGWVGPSVALDSVEKRIFS